MDTLYVTRFTKEAHTLPAFFFFCSLVFWVEIHTAPCSLCWGLMYCLDHKLKCLWHTSGLSKEKTWHPGQPPQGWACSCSVGRRGLIKPQQRANWTVPISLPLPLLTSLSLALSLPLPTSSSVSSSLLLVSLGAQREARRHDTSRE